MNKHTPGPWECERATTCKEFCAHCGPIDTLRYARELYCLRVKQFVMFDDAQEQDEPQMMICSGATICKDRCQQHGYAHPHHDDCDETQEFASDCPPCVPVEQALGPVDEPQPVDLDAIRDRVKQSRTTHWLFTAWEHAREMCTTVIDSDVPAMCAEIERLRRDLTASRQQRDELKAKLTEAQRAIGELVLRDDEVI